LIDTLLAKSGASAAESWPAVLVPHAGLRYSGQIAAATLRQVVIPEQVIVLCPKHTRLGVPWAVAPHDLWALPGQTLPSDPDLARQLADAIPGLELDAAAHQNEHAIEVELPLLARLAPHSKIVGIAIGGGSLDRCRQFATGLAEVWREYENPPLLVISTDMNHYAPDAESRRLDQIALDALHQLDPALVYHTVRDHNISMCGVLPTVIVLETLRQLDALHKCRQVAYDTSAQTTGDTRRVVGYAGMLFG
jgi:AmmeMemoRadiSam system protein B